MLGIDARSHFDAAVRLRHSPLYHASSGGLTCTSAIASTTRAAPATRYSTRADGRGRASSSGHAQSTTNASAIVIASIVPRRVVFARRTRLTIAQPVRRRGAVQARHAANASIIPNPYGRATTAYS